MLEGFYTIASGVLMQERNLNVISNNIANVRTPGFKTERLISSTFEEELTRRIERNNTGAIGKAAPIRITKEVASNFGESLVEETGRPFDIALKGQGYFNIKSVAPNVEMGNNAAAQNGGDQQFLTRNGNFDMDSEGYLILRGVGRVLGEKGEIKVDTSYIDISDDGTITDEQGKVIEKLLITVPADDVLPERYANGLYTVPDFATNKAPDDFRVFQGSIERSNIDLNREMSTAMEAQRMFNACSAALRTIDQLNQKSVSQIASIT